MLKLEWTDVEKLCRNLEQQIRECGIEFDAIYGIARGGLVPATILSHRLGLPLVSKIEGQTLVVDDINDTGTTLLNYSGCENVTTVVLYERARSDIRANFVGETLHHNSWVIMPWEQVKNATEEMADFLGRRYL